MSDKRMEAERERRIKVAWSDWLTMQGIESAEGWLELTPKQAREFADAFAAAEVAKALKNVETADSIPNDSEAADIYSRQLGESEQELDNLQTDLAAALKEKEAEVARAVVEEREACAAIACTFCKFTKYWKPAERSATGTGLWFHEGMDGAASTTCEASAIHERDRKGEGWLKPSSIRR